MSIDLNHLNRTLEKHIAMSNTLLAVVSGLVAQVKESQGEDGIQFAQQKANEIARQMSRNPGVKLDSTLLANIFKYPLG